MANDVLRRFGALTRRAGSAPGTAAAPPQSESARPTAIHGYQQDESVIAEGHRQRRHLLGLRRAEQQLAVLMLDSQRLGVSLSTEVMTRVVVTAYTDTMSCARR